MDDFAQEITALAAIVETPPTELRPFRKLFAADLVSGAAASTTSLRISNGMCAVIHNIEVDSYPKITGAYDFTKRQPYSYADDLLFQWSKDGKLLTEQGDYHLWLGPIFFVVDRGLLTLAVQLANIGPVIDSQFTNITISGVTMPRPPKRIFNRLPGMSMTRIM